MEADMIIKLMELAVIRGRQMPDLPHNLVAAMVILEINSEVQKKLTD